MQQDQPDRQAEAILGDPDAGLDALDGQQQQRGPAAQQDDAGQRSGDGRVDRPAVQVGEQHGGRARCAVTAASPACGPLPVTTVPATTVTQSRAKVTRGRAARAARPTGRSAPG